MASSYESFLESKTRKAIPSGFEVQSIDLNPNLFGFQCDLVRWALRIGRAAIFADTGLGKTAMQLSWADVIHRHTSSDVLILAPLAVASQTAREAAKFGIEARVCREGTDVRPGISIANYERLHRFDTSRFGGVVLDESSILKSYMGKTKQALIRSFEATPYKLACTATPAPNDYLELGNHSEFLGVMPSNEMIARWFQNDAMTCGNYRLKPHGERDYWRWLTSWGVCVSNPEDLGHDGSAYKLPPLDAEIVELSSEDCPPPEGYLFHTAEVSATTLHRVKRATAAERARALAEMVNADDPDEPWLIWCDTNYESDQIRPLIPGAIEVRGDDPPEIKESRLLGFVSGEIKRLVTKPEIAGMGLNFQHCNRMAFIGASFSFERFYQAVRRCHRFGQLRQVIVRVFSTDAESSILKTLLAKQEAFESMRRKMVEAVKEDQLEAIHGGRALRTFDRGRVVSLPSWLRSQTG